MGDDTTVPRLAESTDLLGSMGDDSTESRFLKYGNTASTVAGDTTEGSCSWDSAESALAVPQFFPLLKMPAELLINIARFLLPDKKTVDVKRYDYYDYRKQWKEIRLDRRGHEQLYTVYEWYDIPYGFADSQYYGNLVRFRYDDNSCYLDILQVNRYLHEQVSGIMYERQFTFQVSDAGVSFLKWHQSSKDEMPYFPWDKVRDRRLEVFTPGPWIETARHVLDNINYICQRWSCGMTPKNLEVVFVDGWDTWGRTSADIWSVPDSDENDEIPAEIVLRALTQLKNVCTCAIVLPHLEEMHIDIEKIVTACKEQLVSNHIDD